ncbi:MAG: DUF4416 domain-containing protein [Spirochaetes bacterium]|nr:MAG: DUF4416 domain-containing protein [Spirochaetota bacterium]
MGVIGKFTKEKLIVGVLISKELLSPVGALKNNKNGPRRRADNFSKESLLLKVLEILERHFGPIDYQSRTIEFNFTDYYTEEMGSDIKRMFLSFGKLVTPESLADIKIKTNDIEGLFAERGKRRVNLDPGLLNTVRLILASTKNAPHRIPLRGGIYAEITLLYQNGEFIPLKWTYPDYRSESYREILEEVREIYKGQLKQEREKAR